MKQRPFIGPVELKVVNFGIDTFLVNFKMAGPDHKPNGDHLPEEAAALLDTWQRAARTEHEPVPTPLTYNNKTLMIRPHGKGVWSWLLFNEDVKLSLSYGSMNGGVFCQAWFLSHLLWSIGPEAATLALQATLYEFTRHLTYAQISELHLCADMQGWYDGPLDWQDAFLSRVVTMRARQDEPTEREQEGGLSPSEIRTLEEALHIQPIVTTTHRRLATLDFGSHGSEIMGQIYNKSTEIKKSKKQYFELIWQANGWDGLSTIWRCEMRFKRKGLASFDLNDAYEVLTELGVLWEYATQHWLRYVDLSASPDTNKSRLPAHPVWQCIQQAHTALVEASGDDVAAYTTDQGEQAARLSLLVAEKPVQVLEQAVALQAETRVSDDDQLSEKDQQAAMMQERAAVAQLVTNLAADLLPPDQAPRSVVDLNQVEHGELRSIVEALASEHLAALTPEQQQTLVDHLSPEPFREVRTALVKRSRRMAKKQACIAALSGYLSSLMALSVHEVAEQPDLMASLVVAFSEVSQYHKKRSRVHVEEVWKKRLRYGFITAHDLEVERRAHGIELADVDWSQVQAELMALKHNNPMDVYLYPLGNSSVA